MKCMLHIIQVKFLSTLGIILFVFIRIYNDGVEESRPKT